MDEQEMQQETQETEQQGAGGEERQEERDVAAQIGEMTKEQAGAPKMSVREVAQLLIDVAGPEQARGFAQDEQAQKALADGEDPIAAFRAYRERQQTKAKRAAPATSQRSAASTGRKSPMEMTDEEFRKFDEEIRQAVASGRTVRL